jgi:hypothetical protein
LIKIRFHSSDSLSYFLSAANNEEKKLALSGEHSQTSKQAECNLIQNTTKRAESFLLQAKRSLVVCVQFSYFRYQSFSTNQNTKRSKKGLIKLKV